MNKRFRLFFPNAIFFDRQIFVLDRVCVCKGPRGVAAARPASACVSIIRLIKRQPRICHPSKLNHTFYYFCHSMASNMPIDQQQQQIGRWNPKAPKYA